MKESLFELLVCQMKADPQAAYFARPGMCRVWTTEAIRVAKKFRSEYQLAFRMEARETEIEPFLWHTFLLLISQENRFICDGSGTAVYPPFFGPENQPEHLQNSRLDMLQYYELDDEELPST